MIRFTLYSRTWCHLCDDMLAALKSFALPAQCQIDVIDVDSDPALVEQFDELVPVLFAQRPGAEPQRLCHYFFDPAALRAFLGA